MGKFQACRCGRSVREQKAIHARMACMDKLPLESRREIEELAEEITARYFVPQKSLIRVLRGEVSTEGECARACISYSTMLRMVREFYRRCPLR